MCDDEGGSALKQSGDTFLNKALGVGIDAGGSLVEDEELWAQIMDETPLKKWATPKEIAQWAYFMTVTNTFCTGQSIIIDGGESINHHFVWKD